MYLLIEVAVAAAASNYSIVQDTNSELGVHSCVYDQLSVDPGPVCSPSHGLINVSFVLFGSLIALGALLLRPQWPAGRLTTWSMWLWVAAGLSTLGSGLVAPDPDLELHELIAGPVLFSEPLALIVLGLAIRRGSQRFDARVGRLSVLIGVVSLVGSLSFLVSFADPISGILERIALWPAYLWMPVLAVFSIRRVALS